ncbi:MAG: MBL fold metallo-hydrolase [Paracoccaceae bacterium]|nr:MAG: MBL fold metallo-hydrolase [Paracoccaceae bacterium]
MIRAVLTAAALALLPAGPAAAQDRIPSHCIALAQGPETRVPAAFGAPLEADTVRLRYLDHASFLIETAGGLTAVTDYTGYVGRNPLVPDIVTMNNAHSTHWTPYPDPGIRHVLRGWGDGEGPAEHRLDLGEMLVRNVPTDVRGWGEGMVRADGNSIFIFEVAGLCIGHLGHLHHIPDDAQFAAVGRLDVVMVPVDGGYTLDLPSMVQVVQRFRSSVVVPMHWFSEASLERFLQRMEAEFDVVRLDQPDIELGLRKLPSRPTILALQPAWLDD